MKSVAYSGWHKTNQKLVTGPVITLYSIESATPLAFPSVPTLPTKNLLLVAGKVDRLRASHLLHKRRCGSFLDNGSARCVDGGHKGPLLHARRGCLPQCEAQRSS